MQHSGALWVFTVLLALACAYQLSFSYFTSGLEREAHEAAQAQADSALATPDGAGLDRSQLVIQFENAFLRDHAEGKVYPLLGYSYRECKEKEINLGLDLRGGMAVTLEVSIPELIENLSDGSTDPAFTQAMASARQRQRTDSKDFVSLFDEEYRKIPNHPPLSAIFYSPDRQGMFDREDDDASCIDALRREAETALSNTERILRTRIDKFGVSQPSIQKQAFSGRIAIELPGVKDKERVRKVLQSTANLEFWEMHENTEVGPALLGANEALSKQLYPDLAAADSTGAAADVGCTIYNFIMTKFDPQRHHRRSIRLKGYDYTQEGAYYVTIETWRRDFLFGDIVNQEMMLSPYGEIVQKWWEEIPAHFSNVETVAFVIMPNHVHGVICILEERRGTASYPKGVPVPEEKGENTIFQNNDMSGVIQGGGTPPLRTFHGTPTLGQIIAYFKYKSTKEMNLLDNTGTVTKFWQRNYYEHIIRDVKDLQNKTDYIESNPLLWDEDDENPANVK